MISLSAGQGDALFLGKDNAVAGNHLSTLEGAFEQTIAPMASWDDLLNIARHKPVALLAFQIGVLPQNELEKLREFIKLQPKCLIIGFLAGPIFFNRIAYGKCCYRILESDADHISLLNAVLDGLRAQRVSEQDKVKAFVAGISNPPELPQLYIELNEELVSTRCKAKSLASLIIRDENMAAALIKLVNEARYILNKNVQGLGEAIDLLGVRETPDLVLFHKLFERYAQGDDWCSFAFEHIRNRSFLVAGLVHEICKSVKAPVEVAEQAYLAALLQDIGVLILAEQDPVAYQRITQEASDLKQPLHVVEKLRIGVSHTEIVAHLIAQWGISPAVTEAVLFHHFPASSKSNEFTALTALHIADAILPEVISVLGNQISCHLNYDYLERLGIEGKINQWQRVATHYKPSSLGADGVMCSFA